MAFWVRDSPRRLFFWSAGTGRSGGVAISKHPHSGIQQGKALRLETWSSQILRGGVCDEREHTSLRANVYAPRDRAACEVLFRRILWLGTYMPVLLGGDFNGTLSETLDRSRDVQGSKHYSTALQNHIDKIDLVDAVSATVLNCGAEHETASFRADQHTYHYTTARSESVSSRLDRCAPQPSVLDGWQASKFVERATARTMTGYSSAWRIPLFTAGREREIGRTRRRPTAFKRSQRRVNTLETTHPAVREEAIDMCDSLKTQLRVVCAAGPGF